VQLSLVGRAVLLAGPPGEHHSADWVTYTAADIHRPLVFRLSDLVAVVRVRMVGALVSASLISRHAVTFTYAEKLLFSSTHPSLLAFFSMDTSTFNTMHYKLKNHELEGSIKIPDDENKEEEC
jgi:hypothetical protein